MKRGKDLVKAVLGVLEDYGVLQHELVTHRKHNIVRFEYRGVKLAYTFAKTPGDARSHRSTSRFCLLSAPMIVSSMRQQSSDSSENFRRANFTSVIKINIIKM